MRRTAQCEPPLAGDGSADTLLLLRRGGRLLQEIGVNRDVSRGASLPPMSDQMLVGGIVGVSADSNGGDAMPSSLLSYSPNPDGSV